MKQDAMVLTPPPLRCALDGADDPRGAGVGSGGEREPAWAPLTAAEQIVMIGIFEGESNEVIARRRGTSPRTVANQISSIFRKCGVGSRAELVARRGAGDSAAGTCCEGSLPSTEQSLTVRERDIVGRAARGESNKVIAYELGLAPSTISGHLTKAAAKLGVRSRVELITMFRDTVRGVSDDAAPSATTLHHR